MKNNVFGITNIRTKRFLLQSPNDSCTEELNGFLVDHDSNIIDIQMSAQAIGQVFVLVIYKEVK